VSALRTAIDQALAGPTTARLSAVGGAIGSLVDDVSSLADDVSSALLTTGRSAYRLPPIPSTSTGGTP
jgi:hypothetical protein